MRFEISLAVSNNLPLCADGGVKAVEETLVVLQVRSTDPCRRRVLALIVMAEGIQLAETLKLFIKIGARATRLLSQVPFLGSCERDDFVDFARAFFHVTGSRQPRRPAAQPPLRRTARVVVKGWHLHRR